MSQSQIKALTLRVAELETQLTNVQQLMVNTVAQQIQSLFTNPVMVDSISHRILLAGANAIAHKAAQANDRAPELTVLEGYIPGSLRAILNEDGSMTVEQQLKGAVNAGGQWESATEDYEEQGILETFAQLMSAFGAQAGRVYYITDTVTAGKHREKLAKELASNVTAAEADEGEEVLDTADGQPSLYGICLHLALKSDETKTTSAIFEDASPINVIRGGKELTVPAEEVEDGDVAMITEADEVIAYVVTGTSLAELTSAEELPAGEGEEDPVSDAHVTNGTFHANDKVTVVLKPWNSEVEGQVELAGDELTGEFTVFQPVTVMVEAGEVVKAAWELMPQDVVQITRNECIVKEVVVSVNVTTTVPVELDV